MAHLFATTELEKTYRVNMNVIGLSGKPKVMSLPELLTEWLSFRTDTVKKRLTSRLEKIAERLHLLDGFLVAYIHLDEVIRIIRTVDDPKAELMARYALSDFQAEAILSIRLRQLAKLEEVRIREERDRLLSEQEDIRNTLASEALFKALIKKEISGDAALFGDERRSPVVMRKGAQAFSADETLPVEPVTVILSARGWVRAAKGHDMDGSGLSYKAGDAFLAEARGKSNQAVIFMDSTGRSYTLPAHGLPSARGQGEPLSGKLALPSGAEVIFVLMEPEERSILIASDAGYGFRAKVSDLLTKNKSGKGVLSLPENALPLSPMILPEDSGALLAAATSEGRLLIFPATELPVLSKGKGNKIIHIAPPRASAREELLVHLAVFAPGDSLVVVSGKRQLTLKPGNLAGFTGGRGKRGGSFPGGLRPWTGLKRCRPGSPGRRDGIKIKLFDTGLFLRYRAYNRLIFFTFFEWRRRGFFYRVTPHTGCISSMDDCPAVFCIDTPTRYHRTSVSRNPDGVSGGRVWGEFGCFNGLAV